MCLLLAIIHAGHKFDGPLGITLTTVMLLVVVNGFAVRYLLTYLGHEMSDKLLLIGLGSKYPARSHESPRPHAFARNGRERSCCALDIVNRAISARFAVS